MFQVFFGSFLLDLLCFFTEWFEKRLIRNPGFAQKFEQKEDTGSSQTASWLHYFTSTALDCFLLRAIDKPRVNMRDKTAPCKKQ